MSYQYKNFSDLDFDNIKESLKQYISRHPEFKDYNFEGSALNILLNLLAYNTQYNAFYLNMMSSERFLGTAQRRENVVAVAKNVGYVPYSSSGATAQLVVEAEAVDGFLGQEIKIPVYTMFSASTDSDTFTFYTDQVYSLKRIQYENKFRATVNVFEGKKFTFPYLLGDGVSSLVIPNKNVQNDKIEVFVKTGSVTEQFFPAHEIANMNENSRVYFVEEVLGEKTKIYFGDGIIGKKVEAGSEVTVTYFTSKGSSANNATKWTFSDAIANVNGSMSILTPTVKAANGSEIESIDSVRRNAPWFYESQNRAVTAQDFKTILTTKIIKDVHTISCWGGEDEVPMKLGYVFLSWVTNAEIQNETDNSSIFRSPQEKQFIERELRNRFSTVTIFPQVVDPQPIYIRIQSNVVYGVTKIVQEQTLIETIRDAVRADYENNYSKFQTTLRYSRLSTAIDAASPVIKSNDLKVSFYQEEGSITKLMNSGLSIGLPVAVWSLSSSMFTYTLNGVARNNVFFTDSFAPENKINLCFTNSEGVQEVLLGNVASIDRSTGEVTFNPLFDFTGISGIDDTRKLKIYASSQNKDIEFKKNMIPLMRTSDIVVNITAN